ncbi:hypothetical protein E2C01_043422 [Portunus trituberculatus]|uniref:Uncharacterized protein n=1 Tax=Portunus trituberculatus TaxID=210409 RepID=A0A5B7FZI8_PORTR|nr:hypothetical protein [Portunus trituberculatus]
MGQEYGPNNPVVSSMTVFPKRTSSLGLAFSPPPTKPAPPRRSK